MTDDLHQLAALYGLAALDQSERTTFAEHLSDCESCRREIDRYQQTTGLLAEATATPPPADLKARVMAQISQTEQHRPAVEPTPTSTSTSTPTPAPTSAPPVDTPQPATEPVINLAGERQRRRPTMNRILTLAAAVVLVVAGGFVAVRVIGPSGGAVNGAVEQVAAAEDVVEITLAGQSGADVQVLYSRSRNEAVLVGSNVDDLEDSQVYELWALVGEELIRAGEFNADSGELAGVVDDSRYELAQVDGWAVTVEPAGGSDVATGDILYQGSTQA